MSLITLIPVALYSMWMVFQQGIIINYWLCFCNFKYYINPFIPSYSIPIYKFNHRHKTQSTHTSTGTKVNSFSLDTISFTVTSSQEWWGICTPSSKCLHTHSTLYSRHIASLIPFGPTTISLKNKLSNFMMIIQNVINHTCTLDIFDELSSNTGKREVLCQFNSYREYRDRTFQKSKYIMWFESWNKLNVLWLGHSLLESHK